MRRCGGRRVGVDAATARVLRVGVAGAEGLRRLELLDGRSAACAAARAAFLHQAHGLVRREAGALALQLELEALLLGVGLPEAAGGVQQPVVLRVQLGLPQALEVLDALGLQRLAVGQPVQFLLLRVAHLDLLRRRLRLGFRLGSLGIDDEVGDRHARALTVAPAHQLGRQLLRDNALRCLALPPLARLDARRRGHGRITTGAVAAAGLRHPLLLVPLRLLAALLALLALPLRAAARGGEV